MPRKPVTPEKRREYSQKHIANRKSADPEAYAAYRAKLNRDWIGKNRQQYNKAKSEYRFKLKLDAISHYSNGTMTCARCGYGEDIDALCLDHINDDGAAHRKALGVSSRSLSGGTTIYERLRALNWMPDLQVLCANCNTIKALRLKRGRTAEEILHDLAVSPSSWRSPPR